MKLDHPIKSTVLHQKVNVAWKLKRESWRKAADKYRKKYKKVLQISQVYKKGTGFLEEHLMKILIKSMLALVNKKRD